MITDDIYNLLATLTDLCITEFNQERIFRKVLTDADEQDRSEIAYLLHDMLWHHPQRPENVTIAFERVEKYIATRLKLTAWHAKKDDLWDDLDEIMDELENESLIDDEDGHTTL